MNVTHKQLKAFVAVASTRSFAEACGVVHLSQPALSIAIKNLEESVGGALLVRTTRTLSLTPEGEAFFPVAQRLLADWEEGLEDLRNRFALRRGKVVLGAMPSFACNLLPEALAQFRQRHPAVNVTVNDVVSEAVVDMVRQGRVELGVGFDPGSSEDLLFDPLFDDEFVVVCPQGHALLQRKTLCWQDLVAEDFILLQRPSSIRALIERQCLEQQLELTPAIEAHQLATIGRMVAKGLGISVVPALCAPQMRELGAVCMGLGDLSFHRRVGVLTRRRYALSVAAQALKHTLLEVHGCEPR